MKKIILISAKSKNGKDASAEIMKSYLESKGERVLITHYADLLKYICKTFYGWNGIKDENGRTILQHVGTDIVRAKNENYWVNFMVDFISMFGDDWDYIVIPDTRFQNEIEEVIDSFGRDYEVVKNTIKSKRNDVVKTIRVTRTNFDNGMTWEQLNHPSECALDNYEFDYHICNDGTLEELEIKVKDLLDKLI